MIKVVNKQGNQGDVLHQEEKKTIDKDTYPSDRSRYKYSVVNFASIKKHINDFDSSYVQYN